jgi:hypothetical protein
MKGHNKNVHGTRVMVIAHFGMIENKHVLHSDIHFSGFWIQ